MRQRIRLSNLVTIDPSLELLLLAPLSGSETYPGACENELSTAHQLNTESEPQANCSYDFPESSCHGDERTDWTDLDWAVSPVINFGDRSEVMGTGY